MACQRNINVPTQSTGKWEAPHCIRAECAIAADGLYARSRNFRFPELFSRSAAFLWPARTILRRTGNNHSHENPPAEVISVTRRRHHVWTQLWYLLVILKTPFTDKTKARIYDKKTVNLYFSFFFQRSCDSGGDKWYVTIITVYYRNYDDKYGLL